MNLSLPNHVKVGVKMKHLVILLLFFGHFILNSQTFDSTYIYPANVIDLKEDKILVRSGSTGPNEQGDLLLFDGSTWQKISNDTVPIIAESRYVFSKTNDFVYVVTDPFLWEYDGKTWKKYAIDDSLFGIRHYKEIISLPDSSCIILANFQVRNNLPGTTNIKFYSEIIKFKSGKFEILRTGNPRFYNTFSFLKYHKNGNYSYNSIGEDSVFPTSRILTFDPKGNLIRADVFPDLTSFGYERGKIKSYDYFFDSKGSLWFCTYYLDQKNDSYLGLVEVKENGEINLYNKNILNKERNHDHLTFDIDEEDNIWFDYAYRIVEHPDGFLTLFPSIFKLHTNRTTVSEFTFEDIKEHSIYHNGGNLNSFPISYLQAIHLIKYRKAENSLLISSAVPLLQFFPDRVKMSVSEQELHPIQLYPNPIQFGNIITIESNVFEKGNYPLSIRIQDISGALVREETISSNGNKLQFTTQDLVIGTYFVSVLSNNKTILQTKFIKE